MNRKMLVVILIAAVAAIAALLIWQRVDRDERAPEAATASGEAGEQALDDRAAPSVSTGEQSDSGETAAADASAPSVADQLAETARQINADAPIRIDALTVLAGARQQGETIRYRYEFAQAPTAAQIAQLRAGKARETRVVLCGQPVIRALIADGATFDYAYFGPDGAHIHTASVARC